MKLADRFKSWLRKLGPSDDASEAPVTTVQPNGTAEETAVISQAVQGVARAVAQPPPCGDSSQPKEPSPPPPPSAGTLEQELPAAPAPQPQPQPASQAAPQASANGNNGRSMLDTRDFFAEAVHAEANRYTIKEVIGKGSYGVVCSAVDNFTGEKVAIKKITNVFEHVSDATRIVREIKLLRLLKHPDIVDIKHIMLPPSPKDFRDIYVVFELLETDLHQVIKANDDLTPEHHQFFLYQMLRGLKYIHSAKVFHRDLKPKNILANSDCKLKICDFGLARPAFTDMPTTVFWTDYVATRWYRAPELCGSFFAKYSPAIDIWSVGCIFAEVLLGKPLFPGRNVVHQLELITDLLGTPSPEVIAKVRNEKARRFLLNMRPKPGISFEVHFPRADRGALRLLRRLLAFDPAERPTAEEALADPYFTGLHCVAREPVAQPLSKMAFEFDRRKLTLEDVRELIYREILEYHPQMLQEYLGGAVRPSFHYPSALESFKRQFAHLEAGGAPLGCGQVGSRIYPSSSLPKEWVADFQAEAAKYIANGPTAAQAAAPQAGASAAAASGGVGIGPGGGGGGGPVTDAAPQSYVAGQPPLPRGASASGSLAPPPRPRFSHDAYMNGLEVVGDCEGLDDEDELLDQEEGEERGLGPGLGSRRSRTVAGTTGAAAAGGGGVGMGPGAGVTAGAGARGAAPASSSSGGGVAFRPHPHGSAQQQPPLVYPQGSQPRQAFQPQQQQQQPRCIPSASGMVAAAAAAAAGALHQHQRAPAGPAAAAAGPQPGPMAFRSESYGPTS